MNSFKLGEFVNIRTGKLDANASSVNGTYPFFTCAQAPLRINNFRYDCECVLVAGNGDLNVKYYSGKFDAYQRTYIIESKNKELLDVRYLYHWMEKYVSKLRLMSIGGVIKYIKLNNLTDAPIPLPPLPEQQRIAAILDKADALRAKRREAIAKLDTLLQSVFLEMFGDPVTNPKGWPRITLSAVLSRIESGWSPKCRESVAEPDGWGFLKLGAVTKCEYLEQENKGILPEVQPRPDLEVKAGDVLFSRKNTHELVGACVLVEDSRPRLMISDLIFRLRIAEGAKIDKAYLWALLTNSSKRSQIQKLAGGSAGSMPNISKERLMNQEIELPPLVLQLKYAQTRAAMVGLKDKMRSEQVVLDEMFESLQCRLLNEAKHEKLP